jgi:hypothetical protein
MLINITRSSLNGKFFHLMEKEELVQCMDLIMMLIKDYKPSISGICISEQERQQERWSAWQNCNYNLNRLIKGENNAK